MMPGTLSATPASKIYTSKILKATALVSDTRLLFDNLDPALSLKENLERFRQSNIFGKASRSRVEDILPIFRQRYLGDTEVASALTKLSRANLPPAVMERLFYFYTARSDRLLHDIVTEMLYTRQAEGRTDIGVEDLQRTIKGWIAEGKTTTNWSEKTILRVSQNLMAALRDFGVLEGAAKKRLAGPYLPLEVFTYIAFYLWQPQPSGVKLLTHPEWRLFFLTPEVVERLLVEAHQRRLLEYYAAGSVIRLEFPAENLKEYAHVIAERAL